MRVHPGDRIDGRYLVYEQTDENWGVVGWRARDEVLGRYVLLTTFHPMVAGVTLPGVGLIALVLAPYLDRNPSNKPEDRKFLYGLFTVFLMFWAVLVLIGSFFRGPGFNFVLPWVEGLFFEL